MGRILFLFKEWIYVENKNWEGYILRDLLVNWWFIVLVGVFELFILVSYLFGVNSFSGFKIFI